MTSRFMGKSSFKATSSFKLYGADRRVLFAGEGASSSSKSIPYNRRVLLKGLLRTIAISSYAPGSTVRPQVAT